MKTFLTSLLITFSIILFSCKKEKTEIPNYKEEIVFSTDTNSYMHLQDIAFTLTNRSNNDLTYFGCSYGIKPVIEIEQYINEEWKITHFTLCIEYSWHQLVPDKDIHDTIHSNWIDPGKYRLKCQTMKDSIVSEVWSNEFEIE